MRIKTHVHVLTEVPPVTIYCNGQIFCFKNCLWEREKPSFFLYFFGVAGTPLVKCKYFCTNVRITSGLILEKNMAQNYYPKTFNF